MSMSESKTDVLVVGGGAAGMMAAGTAAALGARVALLERGPRLGRKLRITGKGRCNVTNDCPPEEVLRNIPRNGRFLYSALEAFPPDAVQSFFTELGCPVKTERGGRVFPCSDRAASVVEALEAWLAANGVRIATGVRVRRLLTAGGRVSGVAADGGAWAAPRVILATGGCSYPQTGSTGDGYRLAEAAGHTIVEPRGSLVPLESPDGDCREMAGLSLRNVAVRLRSARGKVVYEDFGELLFTHFGLSGPTILSASAHMDRRERYTVDIDLKPALDEKQLDDRLLRDFDKYRNRDFANALGDLLPRTMISVAVRRSGIPPETKVHSVTREQRRALVRLLKDFSVAVSGPRPVEEAIVTAGGVPVSQVDPRTMASKKLPGLYLAGELLDLDAYTGGFNLQIAWSTGYAAGMAAGEDWRNEENV